MEEGDFKVVLEALRADFKGFGESVKSTHDKIDAFRDETRASFERVDRSIWVVQANMTDVKRRLTGIESRLNQIEDAIR